MQGKHHPIFIKAAPPFSGISMNFRKGVAALRDTLTGMNSLKKEGLF